MKVSVYIPCFNAEEYIAGCLQAIMVQDHPIEEIVVVDDGSTDRTADIVRKFPVTLIQHPSNKGLVASRNTALQNLRGEYIASLDADCIPERDWLSRLMENFSSEKIAGVGGRLLESYAHDPVDRWRAVHMKQEWGEQKDDSVPFLFGSNNVFRKKALYSVGFYDERYRNNYEDVDISRRLKQKDHLLMYEPAARVFHLKKDTISSLFHSFWSWNYDFHKEQGFYEKDPSVKMEENLGLGARFLQEDFRNKRIDLLYIDLILPFILSLKDYLFIRYDKQVFLRIDHTLSLPVLYLILLDLTFFYHFDDTRKSLRTLVVPRRRVLQNVFVFLLLIGDVLKDTFSDSDFLKVLIAHITESIFTGKGGDILLIEDKLLSLYVLQKEWSDFFKKDHDRIEKGLFGSMFISWQDWLSRLESYLPEMVNLIKASQNQVVKTKKEV
ncbi:MAG: glycosyltransferase [Candidatus Omnitrophica bacterium]|nr:glycosyltransferase [Candidatus Omnitrophota bacterium]